MNIRKIKTDRRAILLSQGLRIILAILSILILIYLAVQLTGLFTKKTDLEQARANLGQIASLLRDLSEGGQTTYLLTSPEEWSIVAESNDLGGILYFCNVEEVGISGDGTENLRALDSCSKFGASEKFNLNIEIPHGCRFNTIKNCLIPEKLPTLIYLQRTAEAYRVLLRADIIGGFDFDKILEAKTDPNSKSIKELGEDYVDSEDNEIKEEIKELLDEYFKDFDAEKLLQIPNDKFIWTFLLSREDEVLGSNMFVTRFYLSSVDDVIDGKPLSINQLIFEKNGKRYKMTLRYYDRRNVNLGSEINTGII